MEPEISRRCLACGASVRGTAFFCPECGKPIKDVSKTEAQAAPAKSSASRKSDRRPNAPAAVAEVAPADVDEPTKRNRVKTAAREAVEGKIAPRVEKLRHASNVVLEEASDDPNLRFVLIAVAIFIVALLFLWFNHLLG